VTPLERPKRFADKATLTEQEALVYERDLAGRWADRFGDLEVTTTGELSDEWQENGTVVPGRRTSLIVDPADGKIPALTPEARTQADARAERLRDHPADDPEDRTMYERCLVGSSGPPMLPPVYNQNLQIVQTRDRVLIVTEMIHDARIVRMNAEHLPAAIRLWLGDSVGRWDGDTLVVDTTGFNGRSWIDTGSGHPQTDAGRVTERYTRRDVGHMDIEITIDDPKAYAKPWHANSYICAFVRVIQSRPDQGRVYVAGSSIVKS